MDYSNRKDDSKYPLKAGNVFKLTEPALRFNKDINSQVYHTTFFWIQRLNKNFDFSKTKRQRIRTAKVLFMNIPQIVGSEDKYVIWRKDVQLETLAKYLSKGFELVGTNFNYNYTSVSYKRFYLAIGAM